MKGEGEERTKSRRNRSRKIVEVDGRKCFNAEAGYVARIAHLIVSGAHAGIALHDAREIYPGTEPSDVETALVQASEKFNKPRDSDSKPADLAGVLKWTAEAAAFSAAVQRHGTPDKHARGPAGDMFGRKFWARWCFLSQPFLIGLNRKYPGTPEKLGANLWIVFIQLVQSADKSEYGPRLQHSVEESFERYVAEITPNARWN